MILSCWWALGREMREAGLPWGWGGVGGDVGGDIYMLVDV